MTRDNTDDEDGRRDAARADGGTDSDDRPPGKKGPTDDPNDNEQYRLTVRLDLSDIKAAREDHSQELQVVGRLTDDTLQTAVVELGDEEGVAHLTYDEPPGAVGIYAGPEEVDPEELIRTRTLTEHIPRQRWVDTPELELDPIHVPPYYWDWWRRLCRTFTVTGKLTCPDGTPVPGAEVCAKDVDSWFYWRGTQQVGCAVTDIDGTFEIEFRWCCGLWPRWWWQRRTWTPDPRLEDRIVEATRTVPDLSLSRGGQRPSLPVFEPLLDDAPVSMDASVPELDPDRLEQLRTDLTDRLPRAPELRDLGVWPWAPWYPWNDCRPDLIFEATQEGTVILEQDISDAMWNIDTEENVTLVASGEAICSGDGGCQEPPCPGGECVTVTDVCDIVTSDIGGNLTAPSTPAGYANATSPVGSTTKTADRPFAGRVVLSRSPAPIESIDYIEVEYHTGSGWTPVSRDGLSDFRIGYFYDDGSSLSTTSARFEVTDIGGRLVYPTRERYEETTPPLWYAEKQRTGASGDPNAVWRGSQQNRLVAINSPHFDDGTYRFRLQGYEDVASGDEIELEALGPVTRCLTEDDEEGPVEVVLTFDNRRQVNVQSHGHPTSPAGSGSGTVHHPYVEPDTAIQAVRLTDADGNQVDVPEDEDDECPSVTAVDDGYLEVDFIAHDPVNSDNPVGHLSHYMLHATYGRSNSRNLLAQPSCTITPRAGTAHTGHQSGDAAATYGRALTQGASRPEWAGGEYTLRMNVEDAFPKDCCYQLVLRARKRTIANCNTSWPHRNRSEYSIGYGI